MSRILIIFILISLALATCGDDDSSSDDDFIDDDTTEVPDDDDTIDDDDDTVDDDNTTDDDTDDDDTLCPAPQDPPGDYHDYEAAWAVAAFADDNDLPFSGLYAYFWIDWFYYQGCSYTGALAGLYGKGGLDDHRFAGGIGLDHDIAYLDDEVFDVAVSPYMRFRRDDVDVGLVEIGGDGFSGSFTVELHHAKLWTSQYWSFYDATITDGELIVDGVTYQPRGRMTVERWQDMGGHEPSTDLVQGYWLYAPLHWHDGEGGQLSTLTWYWLTKNAEGEWEVVIGGALSEDGFSWNVEALTFDHNFPENENTDGYLRRFAQSGELQNWQNFSYTARVVSEYRDQLPDGWEVFTAPLERRAHSFVEGELIYKGRTYTGGGVIEWKSTIANPLF